MPQNNYPETSCFNQLQIKYRGVTREKSSDEFITTIIYQGSKEVCEEALKHFRVNTTNKEYGNLESVRMTQDAGPFWNIEVHYSTENDTSKGSGYGPNQSELNVRMISMPLESKKNYHKRWNFNLYATKKNAPTPDFWNTADYENDGIRGDYEYGGGDPSQAPKGAYYCWGKNYSDCPALPQGSNWFKIKKMTKPGIESYDYPSYELTERNKHTTQQRAGWAIAKKSGKIAKPENGDFGITSKYGGDWLCEGGTISWNGRYWESQISYLYSPTGWDQSIYNDENS